MPRRAHRISEWANKYGPKHSTARPHTIALTPRAGSDRAMFAISDPGSTISKTISNMRDQLAGSAVAGVANGGAMGSGFGFEVGIKVCVLFSTAGCEAVLTASAVSQSK